MKRLFIIISIVVLSITFNFCDNKNQEPSEAYQTAMRYYDEAYNLSSNDSISEAFTKFIEIARLLENLPEEMSKEEKFLVSKTYYQMSHILDRMLASSVKIDTDKMALYYQQMVKDSLWMSVLLTRLASAYIVVDEIDSAKYYNQLASHYLDTTSDNLHTYYDAQNTRSLIYYQQKQYDSCIYVNQELIFFKDRRGIDTKNDSVGLGITMYHSPYCMESKPYLLKILEVDNVGQVTRGSIMSLLARIYEKENNADSVAFCQKYYSTYVEAESDRVSNVTMLTKQYDEYKLERAAKLNALLQQKSKQKRLTSLIVITSVVILLFVLTLILNTKRNSIKIDKQKDVTNNALKQHVYTIYRNRSADAYQSILKEFNSIYPDAFEKFKQAYPELSETEQAICLLSFFSFRIKEMAFILNFRENTISKSRSSVIKKTGIVEIKEVLMPFVRSKI